MVAAYLLWHARHDDARRALDLRPRLIAHCAVEAYSALTRMPVPHRTRPRVVREFLREEFPDPSIGLPASSYETLLDDLAGAGITGGAVYDGLVAASAQHAGVTLLTLDARAIPTYHAVGARFSLV